MGLLADDGSALRPADLMVYNWKNDQDICFNVTGFPPSLVVVYLNLYLVVLSLMLFLVSTKKYLDKCSTQGYGLGVSAFTTLGNLGETWLYS